ncbi:MAG: VWA domain-containing protein [Acidobacteriota bacterium]
MELATPQWLWLAAAAPVAALVAGLVWRRRLRATAAWASRGLWSRLLPGFRRSRLVASVLLLAVALAAVALTLAQPRWGLSEQQVERRGVDIVFVLDTSLSMATRDVQPSRIWVAQTLIRQLAQRLPGHRVALVQAEGDGVVLVPLTADVAVLDLLLDAVEPGSLPTPGTELAPALEQAAELFPDGGDKHHVMVVLSDGEDHGSGLETVAADLEGRGVIVHAIGVGTREGKPLELPPERPGAPVEYKRDDNDQVVVSRLMEQNLEALARKTGGDYLRAGGAATDLDPIVGQIEGMELQSYGSESIELLEERFQWPLAAAILALVLHLFVAPFAPTKEEGRP